MPHRVLLIMRPSQLRDRTLHGLCERRIEVVLSSAVAESAQITGDAADVVVVELPAEPPDVGDICARLKEIGFAGVIALGERGAASGAVEALQAGADDYLPRPLNPLELIARVRALLRRLREYRAPGGGLINLGDVVVDCDRHEVNVRGETVSLTPREFELLRELARNAGTLMPREQLLQRVWGYDEQIMSRTLDVHIGRLRKKIECDPADPDLIHTVPRIGYRLAA